MEISEHLMVLSRRAGGRRVRVKDNVTHAGIQRDAPRPAHHDGHRSIGSPDQRMFGAIALICALRQLIHPRNVGD